jgi:hypothetical protein
MDEFLKSRQVITGAREMVNPDTGELELVPVAKTHTFVAGDSDTFYLTYVKFLSLVVEELTGPEIKVFTHLLLTYGTGVSIALIKEIKMEISVKTGLKLSTIDNVLSALAKKDIPLIFRKSKSVYYLNPRYAFKGSSSERNNQMRIIFDLGCKNC